MKIQMRQAVKLKMKVYIAGSEYSLAPGDITERFEAAEAMRLIDRGYAVPVADDPPIETAIMPPPAETRKRKGKRD